MVTSARSPRASKVACVSVLLITPFIAGLAGTASAGPEARVRVRGSSRIDATATATNDGFVLKGTVLEDAGRPVPNARVRVRQQAPDGSARLLRQPQPCTPAPPDESNQLPRGGEEVSVLTDAAGRFCMRWPMELPSGYLVLSFDDARALLDPSERSVEIQRLAAFEVDFAPPPRTVSLDAREVTIEIASRLRGADIGELPLTLLWTRVGAPTTTLLSRRLRPGESASLRVRTRDLGGPGPGELRARLRSGEQTAEAHVHVVATATVTLEVPTELGLSPSGEGSLLVQLKSPAGDVGTGSVEALLGDRTVGIASVTGGEAAVPLALGAGQRKASLMLRYLPASPWWIAGPPAPVLVSVPRASAWRVVFWAAALLAIAGYIASAWRRPPPLSPKRAALRVRDPDVATLQWSAPPKGVSGWTGIVTDAHDGSPVAGASVVASIGGGVESTTVTEPDGSFRLAPFGGALTSGRLRVEGRWHTPFESDLPRPGVVTIALVTRRRALLAQMITWTRRRGAPWVGVGEPTPGELARTAGALADPSVATWARAVEVAAFGPVAVDPDEEARVRALEPDAAAAPLGPGGRNEPP